MQQRHDSCVSCKRSVCYDSSDKRLLTGAYIGDRLLFVHDKESLALTEVTYFAYRVLCNQCLINFQTVLSSNNPPNRWFKPPLQSHDISYIHSKYNLICEKYSIGNHKWQSGNRAMILKPELLEFKAGNDYSLEIPLPPLPTLEICDTNSYVL